MAFSRGRLSPSIGVAVALSFGLSTVAATRSALAGKNDLNLLNLCTPQVPPAGVLGGQVSECSWVERGAGGKVTGVVLDGGTASSPLSAASRFRSLMSELGVVVAPRLQTPADTLGFAGFQFSAEFGMTKISNTQPFWNGVAGVDPANPSATRPDAYLSTVGGFVRKGLWLPLPGFEVGAGAVNVVGSQMVAVQGYAKLALQEGFHEWVLPSVAVRGSISQLLGTDQVDLTVMGIDVLISKAFSVGGTARIEPFGGYNLLFIDARSGVIDATPGCDAFQLEHSTTPPSPYCSQQAPSADDYNANFTFPRQDLITRQRVFAGFKLKLGVLFVVAEYDLIPSGHSRDEMQVAGATDNSGRQQSFSLSAGLDF
jgi:hypothetical protein